MPSPDGSQHSARRCRPCTSPKRWPWARPAGRPRSCGLRGATAPGLTPVHSADPGSSLAPACHGEHEASTHPRRASSASAPPSGRLRRRPPRSEHRPARRRRTRWKQVSASCTGHPLAPSSFDRVYPGLAGMLKKSSRTRLGPESADCGSREPLCFQGVLVAPQCSKRSRFRALQGFFSHLIVRPSQEPTRRVAPSSAKRERNCNTMALYLGDDWFRRPPRRPSHERRGRAARRPASARRGGGHHCPARTGRRARLGTRRGESSASRPTAAPG